MEWTTGVEHWTGLPHPQISYDRVVVLYTIDIYCDTTEEAVCIQLILNFRSYVHEDSSIIYYDSLQDIKI